MVLVNFKYELILNYMIKNIIINSEVIQPTFGQKEEEETLAL